MALTIPLILPLVGGSWPPSFAVWAVPVAATALLMALCRSVAPPSAGQAPGRWWPDWRHRETWQLGLMQGGTGGLYFASNAFIPDYLHAVGRADLVTICLSALNLGQLPASVALLLAARRLGGSKTALVLMQIVGLFGIGTFLMPRQAARRGRIRRRGYLDIRFRDPWLGLAPRTSLGRSWRLSQCQALVRDNHGPPRRTAWICRQFELGRGDGRWIGSTRKKTEREAARPPNLRPSEEDGESELEAPP